MVNNLRMLSICYWVVYDGVTVLLGLIGLAFVGGDGSVVGSYWVMAFGSSGVIVFWYYGINLVADQCYMVL